MSDDILDEIEKHAKYVLELVEYCKSLEQQVRRYRKYADDYKDVLHGPGSGGGGDNVLRLLEQLAIADFEKLTITDTEIKTFLAEYKKLKGQAQ
jgi:hypothetical protein